MSWHSFEGNWRRRTEAWRARFSSLSGARLVQTRERFFAFGGGDAARRRSFVAAVASSNPAAPAPVSTSSTWDQAFERVENYLGAHHIESRELLNRRASEIIAEARRLARQRPEEDPVRLSMHVLHLRMGAWFARVIGEGDWADERFRARGRLALLIANIPTRDPARFLGDEPLAPALTEAMREASLQPGPELRLSKMSPDPLSFIVGDAEAPSWGIGGRWSVARGVVPWALAIVLAGAAAWAASR